MVTYARFRVGSEQYGARVEHVVEISELGDVTPVPGAAPAVLGVRNVRGQVLPVADLAALLGVPSRAAPGLMFVAEDAGLRAGLAISDVVDVCELPEPSPADEAVDDPGPRPLIAGTALSDGDLIGIIDIPAVLSALAGSAG